MYAGLAIIPGIPCIVILFFSLISIKYVYVIIFSIITEVFQKIET